MLLKTSVLVAAGIVVFGLTLGARQGTAPAAPAPPAPAGPPAPFHPHIVATGLRGGYQVVAADMNKDGKVDLIGLGKQMPELMWYENPYWTPHVITRERAAHDQHGRRRYRRRRHSRAGARLRVQHQPGAAARARSPSSTPTGDPKALWTLKEIDAIPTSHRVRFADDRRPDGAHQRADRQARSRATASPIPTTPPTPLRAYRPPEWKPETDHRGEPRRRARTADRRLGRRRSPGRADRRLLGRVRAQPGSQRRVDAHRDRQGRPGGVAAQRRERHRVGTVRRQAVLRDQRAVPRQSGRGLSRRRPTARGRGT